MPFVGRPERFRRSRKRAVSVPARARIGPAIIVAFLVKHGTGKDLSERARGWMKGLVRFPSLPRPGP